MSLRATPKSTCLKTLCLLLLGIVVAGAVRAQPLNYPDRLAETLPGFVSVGWQCVVAPVGTQGRVSGSSRQTVAKPRAATEARPQKAMPLPKRSIV